jgi:hypothetical protein
MGRKYYRGMGKRRRGLRKEVTQRGKRRRSRAQKIGRGMGQVTGLSTGEGRRGVHEALLAYEKRHEPGSSMASMPAPEQEREGCLPAPGR